MSSSKLRDPVSLEDFVQRVPIVNPYWSYADVQSWIDYFIEKCGRPPKFRVEDIRNIESFRVVPTQRLREAFLKRADDYEMYDLISDELVKARERHADEFGTFGPVSRERQRVSLYCRQRLGIEYYFSHGLRNVTLLLSYPVAEVLCKSLGLRPYDVGV